MKKINQQELADKSKSKYGFYQQQGENSFSKMFYEYFLKVTPVKTFINGLITAGVFFYWLFTKNSLPVFIWFVYIIVINFAGVIYWKVEEKRIAKELNKLENELKGIRTEITERQKYFQDLKEKIDKGEMAE